MMSGPVRVDPGAYGAGGVAAAVLMTAEMGQMAQFQNTCRKVSGFAQNVQWAVNGSRRSRKAIPNEVQNSVSRCLVAQPPIYSMYFEIVPNGLRSI